MVLSQFFLKVECDHAPDTDDIHKALNTLMGASYVGGFNVMDGRQLKIVLSDTVSPVTQLQDLEE